MVSDVQRKEDGPSFDSILSQELKNSAPQVTDGIDSAAEATRAIASKVSAAVIETSASHSVPAARVSHARQAPLPELMDEEFRARVLAVVREGLVRSAEKGAAQDRRQLECFDKAVADGTIDVQRAEDVQGLRYRAYGASPYASDGSSGGDEADIMPQPTWDEAFILSRMDEGRSVILGESTVPGPHDVGHYYVSFPNPDVMLTFDQHLARLALQRARDS